MGDKKQEEQKPVEIVVSEELKKRFYFGSGHINLDFTLRVDVKEELEVFAQLLAMGHQAVIKELSK